MQKFLINPNSKKLLELPSFSQKSLKFHRSLPAYNPSPLHSVQNLAKSMGFKNLYIKDESERFTLPAFKILGASYATIKVLENNFDLSFTNIEKFKQKLHNLGNPILVTATDGNHGRAVAHMARILDLESNIFVPKHTKAARIEAIRSEGANVIIVDGNYDKAVEIASNQKGVIIQDTGYPGYEDIPKYIVEGYSTMFWEIEEQLRISKLLFPEVIIAPIGVGSFISAVIQFYKTGSTANTPVIFGVEPEKAPCAYQAIKQDRIISLKGSYESVMAGLSCGKISTISFPILKQGVDGFILVSDEEALNAMKILSTVGITSGESGSATYAGLQLLFSDIGQKMRENFDIDENSNILIFSTEGITDPDMYQAVMDAKNVTELI